MGDSFANLFIDGRRLIKDLKVCDLRAELEKRGLSKHGVKKELLQRLSIFEENRQKSLTGQPNQETPNQWLENEASLDNDFLREYFKSQKALFQEHVERRNQIGVSETPKEEPALIPIVRTSTSTTAIENEPISSSPLKTSKKNDLLFEKEHAVLPPTNLGIEAQTVRPNKSSVEASKVFSFVSFEDDDDDDSSEEKGESDSRYKKKETKKSFKSSLTKSQTTISKLDLHHTPKDTESKGRSYIKVPSIKIKLPETVPKPSTSILSSFKDDHIELDKCSPQNDEVSSSVQEDATASAALSICVHPETCADSTSNEGNSSLSSSCEEEKTDVVFNKSPKRKNTKKVHKERHSKNKNVTKDHLIEKKTRTFKINRTTKNNSSDCKLSDRPIATKLQNVSKTVPKKSLQGADVSIEMAESISIENKIRKDLINLRLRESSIKDSNIVQNITDLKKFAETTRRSARLSKHSPPRKPLESKSKKSLVSKPISKAPFSYQSAITRPKMEHSSSLTQHNKSTDNQDLFESLKQQIELPLHVEKFPLLDKSEVSSTSELNESGASSFHSVPRKPLVLDSHRAVKEYHIHSKSDAIDSSLKEVIPKSKDHSPNLLHAASPEVPKLGSHCDLIKSPKKSYSIENLILTSDLNKVGLNIAPVVCLKPLNDKLNPESQAANILTITKAQSIVSCKDIQQFTSTNLNTATSQVASSNSSSLLLSPNCSEVKNTMDLKDILKEAALAADIDDDVYEEQEDLSKCLNTENVSKLTHNITDHMDRLSEDGECSSIDKNESHLDVKEEDESVVKLPAVSSIQSKTAILEKTTLVKDLNMEEISKQVCGSFHVDQPVTKNTNLSNLNVGQKVLENVLLIKKSEKPVMIARKDMDQLNITSKLKVQQDPITSDVPTVHHINKELSLTASTSKDVPVSISTLNKQLFVPLQVSRGDNRSETEKPCQKLVHEKVKTPKVSDENRLLPIVSENENPIHVTENERLSISSECKVPQHINKLEQPPIISEDPTVISESDHRPIKNEEKQPASISVREQPPIISEREQPPIISEREQPPIISEREQPLIISESEQPPIISEREQPPIISESELPPIISEREQPLIISEREQPMIISEREKPLKISVSEELQIINDERKQPPIVCESDQVPITCEPNRPTIICESKQALTMSKREQPPIISESKLLPTIYKKDQLQIVTEEHILPPIIVSEKGSTVKSEIKQLPITLEREPQLIVSPLYEKEQLTVMNEMELPKIISDVQSMIMIDDLSISQKESSISINDSKIETANTNENELSLASDTLLQVPNDKKLEVLVNENDQLPINKEENQIINIGNIAPGTSENDQSTIDLEDKQPPIITEQKISLELSPTTKENKPPIMIEDVVQSKTSEKDQQLSLFSENEQSLPVISCEMQKLVANKTFQPLIDEKARSSLLTACELPNPDEDRSASVAIENVQLPVHKEPKVSQLFDNEIPILKFSDPKTQVLMKEEELCVAHSSDIERSNIFRKSTTEDEAHDIETCTTSTDVSSEDSHLNTKENANKNIPLKLGKISFTYKESLLLKEQSRVTPLKESQAMTCKDEEKVISGLGQSPPLTIEKKHLKEMSPIETSPDSSINFDLSSIPLPPLPHLSRLDIKQPKIISSSQPLSNISDKGVCDRGMQMARRRSEASQAETPKKDDSSGEVKETAQKRKRRRSDAATFETPKKDDTNGEVKEEINDAPGMNTRARSRGRSMEKEGTPELGRIVFNFKSRKSKINENVIENNGHKISNKLDDISESPLELPILRGSNVNEEQTSLSNPRAIPMSEISDVPAAVMLESDEVVAKENVADVALPVCVTGTDVQVTPCKNVALEDGNDAIVPKEAEKIPKDQLSKSENIADVPLPLPKSSENQTIPAAKISEDKMSEKVSPESTTKSAHTPVSKNSRKSDSYHRRRSSSSSSSSPARKRGRSRSSSSERSSSRRRRRRRRSSPRRSSSRRNSPPRRSSSKRTSPSSSSRRSSKSSRDYSRSSRRSYRDDRGRRSRSSDRRRSSRRSRERRDRESKYSKSSSSKSSSGAASKIKTETNVLQSPSKNVLGKDTHSKIDQSESKITKQEIKEETNVIESKKIDMNIADKTVENIEDQQKLIDYEDKVEIEKQSNDDKTEQDKLEFGKKQTKDETEPEDGMKIVANQLGKFELICVKQLEIGVKEISNEGKNENMNQKMSTTETDRDKSEKSNTKQTEELSRDKDEAIKTREDLNSLKRTKSTTRKTHNKDIDDDEKYQTKKTHKEIDEQKRKKKYSDVVDEEAEWFVKKKWNKLQHETSKESKEEEKIGSVIPVKCVSNSPDLITEDAETKLDFEESELKEEEKLIEEDKVVASPFKSARKVSLNRSKSGGDDEKSRPKRRKWGSSSIGGKSSVEISSESLKSIISDVKPLSPGELSLQLEATESEEEEEEESLEKEEKKEESTEEEEEEEKEEKEETLKKRILRRRISSRSPPKKIKVEEKPSRKIHLIEARPSMPKIRKPTIAPARHSLSRVIIVQNLTRPFTINQLQSMLQRTGIVVQNGFWIDPIKSKCVAMYETEAMAFETRTALHGIKWPDTNPKNLHVDYSTMEDLESRLAEQSHPQVRATVEDRNKDRRRSERPLPVREWDLAKVGEKSPGENEREKERKRRDREEERIQERHRDRSPREERKPRKEVVVRSLDDIFKKTKAKPKLYWLPLTPAQIIEKEALRRKRMAETERKLAEREKKRLEREQERRNRRMRTRSPQRSRSRRTSPRRSRRSGSRDATKSRRRSRSRSRS